MLLFTMMQLGLPLEAILRSEQQIFILRKKLTLSF